MVDVSTSCRFNDIGQEVTITIQTKYADLEVIKLPENCYRCPTGFCTHHEGREDCGRNISWTDEDGQRRPDTCKLKQLDLAEILANIIKCK